MKNQQDSVFIKQVRRKLADAHPEAKREIMLGTWDRTPAFARTKAEIVDSSLNSMVRSGPKRR